MIFNKKHVRVLAYNFWLSKEKGKLTSKVRTLIDFCFNLLHFMQSFYSCNLEREMMKVEVNWVDLNSREITQSMLGLEVFYGWNGTSNQQGIQEYNLWWIKLARTIIKMVYKGCFGRGFWRKKEENELVFIVKMRRLQF